MVEKINLPNHVNQDRIALALENIASGNSKAEVEMAKVDTSGQNNATLKERLDKEHNEVTAQLAQTARMGLINVLNPPSPLQAVIPNGVSDNRMELQNLVNYAKANDFKGVYIPYTAQPFMINTNHLNTSSGHVGKGIQIPSNFEWIMHPMAKLKALATEYKYKVMLNVYDATDVLIKGGTLEGERAAHGSIPNAFAYGLYVCGSKRVHISDIVSKDWWGDGFVTRDIDSKAENNYLQPCEDITFERVTAINACRQGMSVISGKGVRILKSSFLNTNGQAPESGLDLEPNYNDAEKKLENIIVEDCYFDGNSGHSIVGSNTIGLTISNCLSKGSPMSLGANVENLVVEKTTFDNSALNMSAKIAVAKGNFFKSHSGGVLLGNIVDEYSTMELLDNIFESCDYAISIIGGSKNLVIKRNKVQKSKSFPLMMGTGTASNVICDGNSFIENAGYGYFRFVNSEITNNIFIDNKRSLWVDQGGGSIIKNNTFRLDTNLLESVSFMTIGANVEGVFVDSNQFFATASDTVTPLNISANAERLRAIVVRNNVSTKKVNLFTSPPAGVIAENNYSPST